MFQPEQFRSQIPADKFYPPRVDTSPFLYRQRVVEQLLLQGGSRAPAIIIEARAGQGKTTVIKQFLDRTEANAVWYQLGPEDADPTFFLQAILAGINTRLPGFPSAATAQIVGESDFILFSLRKRINLLLHDLDLEDDLYFVFDDLHYLVPHQASLLVVNSLLEAAPSRLHFILSSRESLPLPSGRLTSRNRNLLCLGNRDLAMNEGEVTDFFQQVLHLDVSRDIIKTVTRTTDGWVMGVLLLGLQMERQHDKKTHPRLDRDEGVSPREIQQFFRDEILSTLGPRLHRPLLLLSLLEVIPVGLAVEVTGVEDIGVDLCELVRRNIFFRHLDPDNTLFGLHHLFRQFLREKAAAELSPGTIRQTYQQAGRFYLRRERPARALRYLLQAGDYDAVEAVLEDHGMSFLVTNRTATLTAILDRIPAPLLPQYGWATFYASLAYMDSAPGRVLPLLDQALAVFAARQERLGELLTLSHIISIHITSTGHYRKKEEQLQRAEQLFYQTADTLNVSQTIMVVRNLAMGHCILLADFDRAVKFASLGLNLAREENLINFEAALLMVMGYIQIFAGHTSQARVYLEQAAPYVHHPEIGLFNKLSLRMMLFNFLFHEGDFANYFDQKNQFIAAVGNTLVFLSMAGPFCTVWDMDIAINQGRFEEALDLAERFLVLRNPPLIPHLRSLVLQFKALVLALRRQCDQALPVAEESWRLRDLSGGPYFIALNKLMVGLTCSYCGRYNQAVQLLSAGIEDARRVPMEYLEACGLLHRASVYLRAGARQQAGRDIETGLRLMRRNAYRHLWAWTPAAMREVLAFAVAQRLEPEYARTLAVERLGLALLDDGAAIPLLDIRILGGFKILHRATTLLQAEELTPAQRELLSLLLSAPEFKLPQTTIQLHFWPDSPPDTARVKFDTLVSRLRKTMARVLPADTVHYYLKREKGMFWLAYCRVDALDFLAAVDRGIRHLRLQECWQAGNAFTAAESLWRGEFAPGITGEDRVRACRGKLSRALSDLAFAWCDLLVRSDRLPKAVQVVEKALRDDPLNDRLYGLLYRLQGQSSALLARQVLKRFAAVLRAEDYPDDEIAELIAGITADQPHDGEAPA